MGRRQARQGGDGAQPITRQSHSTSLERAERKKIEPKFQKYVVRVIFQNKGRIPSKNFSPNRSYTKLDLFQGGRIPRFQCNNNINTSCLYFFVINNQKFNKSRHIKGKIIDIEYIFFAILTLKQIMLQNMAFY